MIAVTLPEMLRLGASECAMVAALARLITRVDAVDGGQIAHHPTRIGA